MGPRPGMGQEARRAMLGGGGVPIITAAGNWPVPFPFAPWGPVRQQGAKIRVLSLPRLL